MLLLKVLKKRKRFMKFIRFLFLVLLLITIIISLINLNPMNASKASKDIHNINIVSEEILINEIKNTNKIIPLEIELSKVITIDKSLGNLEIFEKYKRIKFFANCSYYIDLSLITDEDIKIDKNKSILELTITKPEIFNIDILRDKTIYEDTSNGLFRFGDIKLTSEEFNSIQEMVDDNFRETLQDKEIYDKALLNSKISITQLLQPIIGDDFTINISFK